jgi:hypothetical protein
VPCQCVTHDPSAGQSVVGCFANPSQYFVCTSPPNYGENCYTGTCKVGQPCQPMLRGPDPAGGDAAISYNPPSDSGLNWIGAVQCSQ